MNAAVPCSSPALAGSDLPVQALNNECFCFSLDKAALRQALESEIGQAGLFELVEQRCPYLFAAHPVFVATTQRQRMAEVVRAVESVVALPAYRELVLQRAPAIARHAPHGVRGVFFGYDFHSTDAGVGLIEINTNAGGAMLNSVLARAQRACCPAIEHWLPPSSTADTLDDRMVAMFRAEWELSGSQRPLTSIAIVDDDPQQQYLYPEFLLFQQLFQRHGLQAIICDPAALSVRDGRLWHGAMAIDLVYNRLTDFYLQAPGSAALREAWLTDAAVLTPHPQAHALYADKRNLAIFSDAEQLQALGVAAEVQEVLLGAIPRTELVTSAATDRLWRERRQFFFKPEAGYGSRAAYRGDKLTRRVWQDILQGGYVAQALVLPGARTISEQVLKFDLRLYAYAGEVQWTAARLYQGQTTNFRTPGGGFAPVYSFPGV